MKRWMIVQMCEEYCSSECGEYTKALRYLIKILPEYRSEAWLPLFSTVLQMALHCSYVIADIHHFTEISIGSHTFPIAYSVPVVLWPQPRFCYRGFGSILHVAD